MVSVNRVSVRRRPDGRLAVSIPLGGKMRTVSVDATNPIYAFLSRIEDDSAASASPSGEVIGRWLFQDPPVPMSSYPDVDPVDFRFPIYETVGGVIEWWDRDSPFAVFMSGRKGSGRTSFLSGVNHSLQYANRTNIIELPCRDMSMLDLTNKLRSVQQNLKDSYRDNSTVYRNPFRRVNTVILIDDFPSPDYPSVDIEVLYAEMYDFLGALASSGEYVKVIITSDRPLPSLFYTATEGNYATMREVENSNDLVPLVKRMQMGSSGATIDRNKDLLGSGLWTMACITDLGTVETLVKTPKVNARHINLFLSSAVEGAPVAEEPVE